MKKLRDISLFRILLFSFAVFYFSYEKVVKGRIFFFFIFGHIDIVAFYEL